MFEIKDSNKQKRRRVPMLKSTLGKLKYLLLVTMFLSVAPLTHKAEAGLGLIFPITAADTDNDKLVFQHYFFWDLRGGESYFQITNTGTANQLYHIQVFNVQTNCEEFDFTDNLTPLDTHVYNVRSLTSNTTSGGIGIGAGEAPDLTDGYGFVVATLVDAQGNLFVGDLDLTDLSGSGSSLGNFRIIRDEGYEYRANAASVSVLSIALALVGQDILGIGVSPAALAVPFGNVDGAAFTDVVGIPVVPLFDVNTWSGTGTVSAGGTIFASWSANIFDQNEQPTSCSPVAFACDLTASGLRDTLLDLLGSNFNLGFDMGVNQRYPASRVSTTEGGFTDGDNICTGNDSIGQLRLEAILPINVIFMGFVGVNNGDGTGSMDSFWSLPFFNVGFEDVFGLQALTETLADLGAL